jgi:hypothetical protein
MPTALYRERLRQRMESGPTIARGTMPVVKEAKGIGDEFEGRRTDALGLPVDINAGTKRRINAGTKRRFAKRKPRPGEAGAFGGDERGEKLDRPGNLYAVLSVNYRESTGFGKAFVNAANREWAGRMHDDLIDAVDWAIERRIADSARVAITSKWKSVG